MYYLFFLLFFNCSANDLDVGNDFKNCTRYSKQQLDTTLKNNLIKFKSYFKDKKVILSDNQLVDYALFLSQYAKNENVAYALDYLIKTGAGWGISSKKANSYQASVLSTVAQITKDVKKDWQKDFGINYSTNQKVISQIQNTIISDKSQFLIDALTNKDCKFLIFEKKFLEQKYLTNNDFNKQSKQNIFFGNDFYWFGFCLGIFKDSQNRLLEDILNFDNNKKESEHNYIQWLFPISTIGMGDSEPRTFTLQTYNILKVNPKLFNAVQEGLRKSFYSMFNFWGQNLEKKNDKYEISKINQELENSWIINTHNYLRMNRILQCLRLFNLHKERDAVFNYLESVVSSLKHKNISLEKSFDNFWQIEYKLPTLIYR